MIDRVKIESNSRVLMERSRNVNSGAAQETRVRRNETVTLFIDNLPKAMTRIWLWQLFKYDGSLVDAYLSKKIRRNNDKLFGFVRYRTKEDALKAIRRLDGQIIRECKIKVKEAQYSKRNMTRVNQTRETGGIENRKRQYTESRRDQRSYKEAVLGVKKQDEPRSIVITGKVAEENKAWLCRSIVGEHMNPLKVEEVRRGLEARGVRNAKVGLIDSYKVLITLETEQEAMEILKKGCNILQPDLEEIRPWTPEEVCKVRRIWLECIGIPLHAWSMENFVILGNQWGRFVKCHDETFRGSSFMSAKIQIDTTVFNSIEAWVCLAVEGAIYDVMVKEFDEIRNQDNHASIMVSQRGKQSDEESYGEDEETPVGKNGEEEQNMPCIIDSNHHVNTRDNKVRSSSSDLGREQDKAQPTPAMSFSGPSKMLECAGPIHNREGGMINQIQGEEDMILGLNRPLAEDEEDSSIGAPPGFSLNHEELIGACSSNDVEVVPDSLGITHSEGEQEQRVAESEQRSTDEAKNEANQAWKIGKTLGLHSTEDERVLQVLEKINKGQDVGGEQTTQKRKRGRPRKKN